MRDRQDMGRPDTTAGIVREAVGQLEQARHAVEFLADVLERPAPEWGAALVGDLELVATWLDIHPEADVAIRDLMIEVDA